MQKIDSPYKPRTKTPEQALSLLMRQCARAERCSSDALRSMRRWGLSEGDAGEVLRRLVAERFIDDGRYAAAYVREKMKFSGWGARKIAAALRTKYIAPNLIAAALEQMEPESDLERLEEMLRRKAAKTTARNAYDLKGKLVRFGVGRGFDLDQVIPIVERIVRDDD